MEIKYEFTGGIVETPEKGSISIPPEKTARKDIEEGTLLLKVSGNTKDMDRRVKEAKKLGVAEIPNNVKETEESR